MAGKRLKLRELTPEERRVIVEKGTEAPFTGEYHDNFKPGAYFCRQCGAKLYRSEDKFKSGCGWPSFDDSIPGAVKGVPDRDGIRTEIQCARCGAHLGHVFEGEKFTSKDTRHCVNSISMLFVPDETADPSRKSGIETIVLGGGCFWCTEAVFLMLKGVKNVVSGYAGGILPDPTYEAVSTGLTGHIECNKVEFDPKIIPLERILDVFFEMHDPTSKDMQGADIGSQYRSAIFCTSTEQMKEVESYIESRRKDYASQIVTDVRMLEKFYKAEEYHQDYYSRNPKEAYCRLVISPKLEKIRKEFQKELA